MIFTLPKLQGNGREQSLFLLSFHLRQIWRGNWIWFRHVKLAQQEPAIVNKSEKQLKSFKALPRKPCSHLQRLI